MTYHVSVPDGLDLVKREQRGAVVHDGVQVIEHLDDLLRRHRRADVGEAHDITEEDRHLQQKWSKR